MESAYQCVGIGKVQDETRHVGAPESGHRITATPSPPPAYPTVLLEPGEQGGVVNGLQDGRDLSEAEPALRIRTIGYIMFFSHWEPETLPDGIESSALTALATHLFRASIKTKSSSSSSESGSG